MALVEGLNEAVRGSARGSLQLMVGQVASTVVSALTVMAVASIIILLILGILLKRK